MIAEQEIRAAATPQTSLLQLVWRAWPITSAANPFDARALRYACVRARGYSVSFFRRTVRRRSGKKKFRKTKTLCRKTAKRLPDGSSLNGTGFPSHRRQQYCYYYHCIPIIQLRTDPYFSRVDGVDTCSGPRCGSACKVHPPSDTGDPRHPSNVNVIIV